MTNLKCPSLTYSNGQLKILDQRLLPHQEVWVDAKNPDDMVEIIKNLQVRGAPLIGVAASLSLADYAQGDVNKEQILEAEKKLRASRPTAVNLMMALDRQLNTDLSGEALMEVAVDIFNEDVELCQKMAENGAALVNDGDHILTHCNTGSLATAGVGTALGVIREAHRQGKKIHVWVDETRPLLQGGRLTAWELEKAGIPYSVICDNMAATIMREGKVDKIFVGSDRIALNGDFANKIGTYNVAILAQHHGVPFYPVAPYTTIDWNCEAGKDIPIEERNADEVRGVAGYFDENNSEQLQKVIWSPKTCEVRNPAFDVTPVELVTGLVLDKDVYSREQLQMGVLKKLKEELGE